MKKTVFWTLIVASLLKSIQACTPVEGKDKKDSFLVAQTPPMGWNSFDAYDSRINEAEFKATVDFMDKELKDFGWEYAVVDYVWYHHTPGGTPIPGRRFGHPDVPMDADGKPLEGLVLDKYGRLWPSEQRFPSAKGNLGFKALADYVHSKGMKFGIHIMRGIPREAYFKNLPIKGTKYTAQDIAEPWDTCNWNNHMYGVDASKPGAQEYYNSIFELYAEWGVDFIKADDTMFPPYHKAEIELISNALKNCGRPMVLSLSCGEAPVSQANHVIKHANMWRISADFWDNWESLYHNFELLNAWSPFIGPGHWPDADMLPIGKISLNNRPHGPERESEFTVPEHYTLMTLWSIAKSPLMIGADLLSTKKETIDTFLKNKEILYVNQHSTGNRQVIKHQNKAVWVAEDPANGDLFVALFNTGEKKSEISFRLEDENIRGRFKIKELWTGDNVKMKENLLSSVIDPHGAKMFRLSKLDSEM